MSYPYEGFTRSCLSQAANVNAAAGVVQAMLANLDRTRDEEVVQAEAAGQEQCSALDAMDHLSTAAANLHLALLTTAGKLRQRIMDIKIERQQQAERNVPVN